jgi:hypothetical protein
MMEYWNNGIMGRAKIDSLLSNPVFQHPIIPIFQFIRRDRL